MTMASRNKPGRPKDETLQARRREEILDAAAKLFAERGYPNTDLQVVADVLTVGKGTIYRYFPSKRDLFLAAVDRGMHLLDAHIEGCIDGETDPLERFYRAIRAYLAFFAVHPELVELFVQERAEFKDRKQPIYFEFRESKLGEWREHFRTLVEAGRLRDLPVDVTGDVVNDVLYGTIFANHFTGRHTSHEEQARRIIDIVFHGLLTEAERKRGTRKEE